MLLYASLSEKLNDFHGTTGIWEEEGRRRRGSEGRGGGETSSVEIYMKNDRENSNIGDVLIIKLP